MFYIYVMLDQRKPGEWIYKNLVFDYQPFYVGVGRDYRMTAHFTPTNLKKKNIKNNIINSIKQELNDYPIYYKIYNNLSKEKALKIEIDFIKYFGKIKDKTGILSNLTSGGDGIYGFKHSDDYKNSLKKKLYQYDLEGNYVNEWESLKSVIKFFNLSGGNGIRKSINEGFHCKKFLWSHEKLTKLPKHKGKGINKFNYTIVKDNFTKTFSSNDEIRIFFNKKVNFGNVTSCCNGKIKTYLGYKWYKTKK